MSGMPLDLLAEGAVKISLLAKEIDDICCEKRIRVLDIGGGLPVNYSADEESPSFSDYFAAIIKKLPSFISMNSGRLIITEFGKSIIAKCGVVTALIEDVLSKPILPSDSSGESCKQQIAISHAGADLFLRTAYCPHKFSHRIALFDCKMIEVNPNRIKNR
jgi:diaminopimelate decarboxylase